MKLRRLMPVLVLLPVLALVFSCKSAPEAPAEPPAQEPLKAGPVETPAAPAGPSQDSLDALAQAKSDLDDLRKLGQAIGCPDYETEDWNAAEQQYTDAGSKPQDTQEQVNSLTDLYKKLGATYQDIIDRTADTIAAEKRQEIADARQAAIDAGIETYGPDYLAKADATADMAEQSYEAKDYMPAVTSADDAIRMYELLKLGCETWELRRNIVEHNLDQYDPENFNKADDVALTVLDNYDAGNVRQAQDDADEAHLRYNLVYNTGWQTRANDSKSAADEARRLALQAKANVAVKAEFAASDDMYNKANTSYATQDYDEASQSYERATTGFTDATAKAIEKRRIADQAMKEAAEKMVDSEEKAKSAEAVLGGGSL